MKPRNRYKEIKNEHLCAERPFFTNNNENTAPKPINVFKIPPQTASSALENFISNKTMLETL